MCSTCWLLSLAHVHGLHNRDRDLYSTRGVLVQLMLHVYWESPFPIKNTNEILQSYSYPSQARYLEVGILEQLESSASTGDRKEMINEFVQRNLLCAVAIILLACMKIHTYSTPQS